MASARVTRYSEAARQFEQCARSSGDAGLWKKAGMARYSARQYAHTIQALDAYLKGAGASDPQGEAMLDDARKNAAAVRFSIVLAPGAPTPERLRVAPRDAAPGDEIEVPWASSTSLDVHLDPGRWTAELLLPGGARVGPQDVSATADTGSPQVVLFRVEAPAVVTAPPTPAASVEVELSLGPGAALRRGVEVTWTGAATAPSQKVRKATSRWPLAPGTWQLRAAASRFEPQTRAVEVRAGEPLRLSLALERTREDRVRIGLAAGLGGVSLGLLAGGLAGALGARTDYREALARLDGVPSTASLAATSEALSAIQRTSNGTVVAASAGGSAITAITVAAGGNKQLLAAEIGTGMALLIAGVAWLVPVKRRYSADAPTEGAPWVPDRGYLDEHRRPELAAAALIGLGVGLAAGATVALVARTLVSRGNRRRSVSVRSIMAPRSVGLALQGTF